MAVQGARGPRSKFATAVVVLLAGAACGVQKPGAGESFAIGGGRESTRVGPSSELATRAIDASTDVSQPHVPVRVDGGQDAAAEAGASIAGPKPGEVGGGTSVLGVTENTIRVVYYWRAAQGENNPFLQGSGANSDEGSAFLAWVKFINEHPDGDATIMGFPFNLHGRRIEPVVVDSGATAETAAAAAERIAKEIKPFAALSNWGSGQSTRMCPPLADAGILNLATWDMTFDLSKRTNGYCLPWVQSFDTQVAASERFLVRRMAQTEYEGAVAAEPRKFGFAYAELPQLDKSAPLVAERFERAGLPIVAVASASGDLQSQAQQSVNIVAQFRSAGVNSVIIPDGILPLTFTQAAEAQGYEPDYYIWPCSGQDVPGLARFFNARQWARAWGLTCLDPDVSPDQVHTEKARSQEWWGQYQSVAPTANPPAQAPQIYISLLQLVAGISNAGRDLTPETFRRGLEAVEPYRYSFIDGRTDDGVNMLLRVGEAGDYSTIGDFTQLRWVNESASSNEAPGMYVYPEDGRRHSRDGF